jgi:YebC/PmpR family DNA-binding regulatory protein
MSGHSKWSTIKRQKWAQDAKRAAVFTKLARNITVAAREGGGDPETNFKLRLAVDKAKSSNMPKDNIERAIKKGTGELKGEALEECLYEGMGPANTQFIIKSFTDNRNRSASNIKHIFNKYGGSFTPVMWNFKERGVIRINKEEVEEKDIDPDEFELELIEQGAQDIEKEEEGITIYTDPKDLASVKKFLDKQEIKIETADIEYIPSQIKKVEGNEKERVEKFMEALEDCEDVNDYYNNCEF